MYNAKQVIVKISIKIFVGNFRNELMERMRLCKYDCFVHPCNMVIKILVQENNYSTYALYISVTQYNINEVYNNYLY